MKSCSFNPNQCSVECKKYSICSYYSIQNQFIEIQSQLNFIYNTISKILESNIDTDTKLNIIEEVLRNSNLEVVDSETIVNFKESKYEKEN